MPQTKTKRNSASRPTKKRTQNNKSKAKRTNNAAGKKQTTTPDKSSQKQGVRKEMIFIEAAKLFRENGYKATNMRALANQVGIKPSSLYSHIKSKDDLLQKICFDCAEQFTEGMKDILIKKSSALNMIEDLISLHINIAKNNPASITVFNDEWQHLKEPFLSKFKAMRRGYEQSFKHIIQLAIEKGEIKDIDPEIIMRTLLSSLRWIQLAGSKKRKWSKNVLTTQLTELLLNGMQTHY